METLAYIAGGIALYLLLCWFVGSMIAAGNPSGE